jgi:hypothetical protein
MLSFVSRNSEEEHMAKMTEEQFLAKLKALQKVKGMSDIERLLDTYYGGRTQQQGRRGR